MLLCHEILWELLIVVACKIYLAYKRYFCVCLNMHTQDEKKMLINILLLVIFQKYLKVK